MILETIVSTQNMEGRIHLAPMGVHANQHEFIIMPFHPSTTLDNMLATRTAVINHTDDVRIFAGCLTGRREWPTRPAHRIKGCFLSDTLAHTELELLRIEQDATRPKLFCKAVFSENHAPFKGFNRAQHAVLEAAILVSRLHLLPWEKISTELEYLRIGLEKTAGDKEREAWQWLMQAVDEFKQREITKP